MSERVPPIIHVKLSSRLRPRPECAPPSDPVGRPIFACHYLFPLCLRAAFARRCVQSGRCYREHHRTLEALIHCAGCGPLSVRSTSLQFTPGFHQVSTYILSQCHPKSLFASLRPPSKPPNPAANPCNNSYSHKRWLQISRSSTLQAISLPG